MRRTQGFAVDDKFPAEAVVLAAGVRRLRREFLQPRRRGLRRRRVADLRALHTGLTSFGSAGWEAAIQYDKTQVCSVEGLTA